MPFPTYLIRLGVITGRGPNRPRLCVRGSGGLISARKLACVQLKLCTQLLLLLSCIMLSQWQRKITHLHQYYLFEYAVADINCHYTCIKIRVALMHPNFTAVRQQVDCSSARLFHFPLSDTFLITEKGRESSGFATEYTHSWHIGMG